VPVATADDLDRALAGAHDSLSFEAEDGRYTVPSRRSVRFKRFARESRVGSAQLRRAQIIEGRVTQAVPGGTMNPWG